MKKIISLLLTIFVLSAIAGMTVSADAIDHYLVGDADGDGAVTVLDATKVQRLLADYVLDEDGMIALRGDVNGDGISILDATFIQRFLADYDDGTQIGAIVYLDPPTEPQTAAPTQLPTRDPYELPFIPSH